MCNLSQGVMERGVEKGRVEGRAEGIGIGVDTARIESIKALMKNMNMTLEQAIQVLQYPMADKEKFAAALN